MLRDALLAPHVQIQNFPFLATEGNFHGTATNLTIHNESLRGLRGVHRQLKGLPTKWTLNSLRFLHLPEHQITDIVTLSNFLEFEAMQIFMARGVPLFCRAGHI
jgi:hypothetical protein